jgi:hypothetical protein
MTFYETITAAINDILEHGFDTFERIERWLAEIRQAAVRVMMPEDKMAEVLGKTFETIYTRLVEKSGTLKVNPGVSLFTLNKIKPKLRDELDRRIMASANLIVQNREEMIAKTLQRFQGWATSIPPGGSDAQGRLKTKASVGKALKQLPFEERRVLIDQGHKLTSTINDIVAQDGGAIAAVWHSNWRQVNYNYRKDHKERDEQIYLIRDSWAHKAGLVKPGPAGYYDEITKPGEEVFCRCSCKYLFSIGKLPGIMLTAKGAEKLAQVRKELAA